MDPDPGGPKTCGPGGSGSGFGSGILLEGIGKGKIGIDLMMTDNQKDGDIYTNRRLLMLDIWKSLSDRNMCLEKKKF
jgi:hypothetical protein